MFFLNPSEYPSKLKGIEPLWIYSTWLLLGHSGSGGSVPAGGRALVCIQYLWRRLHHLGEEVAAHPFASLGELRRRRYSPKHLQRPSGSWGGLGEQQTCLYASGYQLYIVIDPLLQIWLWYSDSGGVEWTCIEEWPGQTGAEPPWAWFRGQLQIREGFGVRAGPIARWPVHDQKGEEEEQAIGSHRPKLWSLPIDPGSQGRRESLPCMAMQVALHDMGFVLRPVSIFYFGTKTSLA